MGLLSRRGSGRGTDRSAGGAAPPVEPAASPDPVVFRAATAADIPDWAKLPPLAPSLPLMPLIVPDFRPSLISLQHPKRFVEKLGHSVSAAAPSGVVEAIGIISPSTPVQPADTRTR